MLTIMKSIWYEIWIKEWPTGLGVATRIGRFLVPIPLGTWLGLRSQPRYKAPSDLQFKIVEMQ